ncbi:MAG TPA: carboxypeptidase-like regulatory domain-containing protein, partial [Vicinamibacterales bacterium]|nr:carboxypeptidase-like regulatory domain-containing protein [Vicinamibacterales bacterium]
MANGVTRALVFGVVAFVATVSGARAQVQTGSIVVKATDDQGAVVPGVTVTISSPILPRELTGVTDASGIYQLPGLSVGIYTIKTTLQGFQTVIREDVVVQQGQTASIEMAMKVSTIAEEVTVRGESPVVDTKAVGAKVNIDTALLEKAPGGRDIWNVIEYKAPGVVVESPDVGGNQ